MRHFHYTFNRFKTGLRRVNAPTQIIWLGHKNMIYCGEKFYVNLKIGTPTEEFIEKQFNELPIEQLPTLILVAATSEVSYCSLLLGAYDSNARLIKKLNALINIEPYVKTKPEAIYGVQWLFKLWLYPGYFRPLSDLDFASS